MINSLTIRIFAIFWLTLALVLVLVLYIPHLDKRKITTLPSQDKTHLTKIETNIELDLSHTPNVDFLWWYRLLNAIQHWTPPGERLILVTNEGRILGLKSNEIELARMLRNFIGLSDNITHPKKKKYGQLEILGPILIQDYEKHYQLYLIRPARSLQSDFINLLFDKPIWLMFATMLISTPLLLWLSWSLAKPARKLKIAAENVINGDLQAVPALESGPLEFRAAGVSFNQMLLSLKRMMVAQQRLISDISHELRTPLTRLQLATALMRRRSGESRELERIETEAQRLDHMINKLLELSRNRYQNEFAKTLLQIDTIWPEILENAQFEAEQVGKALNISNKVDNSVIFGNKAALESALENIIRNALRYSFHTIEINFNQNYTHLLITVDDDGPGVAEQEREQIFRPFYRTDEARDRTSGGTGLGLAIVESIISQHSGWVKAEDSPLGGLRLSISLPLQG